MLSLTVNVKDEIAQRTIARIRRLKKGVSKSARASVGIHEREGAKPKVNYYGRRRSTITLVEVMRFHEYGIGQKPRPWLSGWFDSTRDKKLAELRQAVKRALAVAKVIGNSNALAASLGALAGRWAKELSNYVFHEEGHLADLAESTIKAKEDAGLPQPEVPLVATHQFIQAVRAKVNGRYVK